MLFVGLTGSISTGKSTVAKMFEDLGCYVIDADKLAHRVYEKNGEAYEKIIEIFGESILDDSKNIDRKKLGGIVLDNKKMLKKLETVVHPAVERLRNRAIEMIKSKSENPIIIYDVPLLFEKNMKDMFDFVIVVYTDRDKEIERLMKREGITKQQALERVALQMSVEEKAKAADFVIDNSHGLENTRQQVEKLFLKLRQMSSERG